ETPRGDGGAKLCAWCGGTIRQGGIGRSRDYCKAGCRQRAYEERRSAKRVAAALAAALSPRGDSDSSRDETKTSPRDETEIPVQATVRAEVDERLVVDVPDAAVPEQTALEVPGIVPEPKPRPKGTVSDVFALFKGIQ
ncbi:hypothetical protein O3W51_48250, partial [Streptomyces sp. H39-C1]|nr:hypothetical protein [Streptomyces sp. H39-C1]